MRSLTLFAALLVAAAIHAAEVPIAPPAAGPAYGSQTVLDVGSNGDGYFVTWQDVRDGGFAYLAGSRVTADGTLLDPYGILIAPMTALPDSVRVRGEGDGFVVEYAATAREGWRRHVHADGSLGAPVAFALLPALQHAAIGGPRIVSATNGEERLHVGRQTSHEASQLVSVRTNAAGEPLGEPFVFPPLAAYGGMLLDLQWTGRDYVLLFQDVFRSRSLRALRIGRDGRPVGDVIVIAPDASYAPVSVASRGDGSFAVLYEFAYPAGSYVVRVDESVPAPLSLIVGSGGAIASDGRDYVVAWNVDGGIAVEAVKDDLLPQDGPLPQLVSREETLSTVAQKSANSDRGSEARLLVWTEEDGRSARILAHHPDAPPASAFRVTPRDSEQRGPAVARAGDRHLVVWYEKERPSAATRTVEAMLLDVLDEPLLPRPLTIGSSASEVAIDGARDTPDTPPAVVWTGQYFLVAWTAAGQLRLARVTASGLLLDERAVTGIHYSWQGRPVLVRAGATTFLVWQQGDLAGSCPFLCVGFPASIHALRLDPAGRPLDPSPVALTDDDFSAEPDAAWNGRLLAVTWVRNGTQYVRYLDAYGNAFDPFVVATSVANGTVIANGDTFEYASEPVGGDVRHPKFFRTPSGIATMYERLELGIPRIYLTLP